MRIAVCEDDRQEMDQLTAALKAGNPARTPECFADGASLLEAARMTPHFDVAFLDIYLPGESGVDLAKNLARISPETGIAFVTFSRNYALEAFHLNVLHYVIKPVSVEDVEEVFRRRRTKNRKQRAFLELPVGREVHHVCQDEIVCLQSVSHAVEVNFTDGRMLRVWIPLGKLEEKLEGDFLKLSRGTIANMEHIARMGVHTCDMRDGTRLIISGRLRKSVRETYDAFLNNRE